MHAPIEKTNALLFRFFEDLLAQQRGRGLPVRPQDRHDDHYAEFERAASAADDRHQAEKEGC